MKPATGPTNPPLGTGSSLRRRLLWHYVPLAAASVTGFVLWMTLPLFEPTHHARDRHQHAEHAASDLDRPQAVQQAARAADHRAPQHEARHHDGPPWTGGHQGPQQSAGDLMTDGSGHQAPNGDGRQNRRFMARVTTATGYVALGILAFTLLLGPANLLLRRRNPVSNYLRRDAGAWTAMVSVIHVIVGLQVHGPPAPASLDQRILRYFFGPDGSPLTNSFGLGNWTGLAATVIVVGLLALSNDFALRKLKAGPWKWLQRLNYALFALVVAHAIFYGALLRVTSPSTLLLGLSVLTVFTGQAVGVRLWRRRYARNAARLTRPAAVSTTL